MGNKKKWKRTLPVLLAALLWAEGTLGTVCASESVIQGLSAEGKETMSGENADICEETTAETEKAEEGDKSALAEQETPGEEEYPDGEKQPEQSGTETPGEGEQPDEGVNPAPGETETPGEGENPVPGEADAPDEGGEMLPAEGEQPDGEETDASATEEQPTVSENTVSENTTEEEENLVPEDWNGEPTLGEPPLMTGGTGRYAAYSDQEISPMAAGSGHRTPGVGEIIDRYKAYPWSLDVANGYSVTPSVSAPYAAGHLKDNSLENAMNLLNFIRYVAGVPTDVTLSEDYTEKAQAGALLNRVGGKLDHKPGQPDGFPDDLYQTGYAGCSNGNIAAGYGNIAKTLLNGWMYDGDAANVNTMGHRRWILNPSMSQTGFGAVGSYSVMYVRDSKGSGITDYVAWPAQNMPIELMNGSGTPWTLSLGSDYKKASFQSVTVTLKDITNNKSWSFSGSNATGVFKVNVEYYGMPNCIIFRPSNVRYNKDSQFQVTVSGIKLEDGTENGKDTTLSYNVDFFSLKEEPAEVASVALDRDTLHLLKGVEGKQEETLLAAVQPGNARDKELTWASKDESVATVDGNGKVTAVGVGTTEISATAKNGVQDVCTVKVSDYSLQSDANGFFADKETKTYRLSFDLTMNAEQGRLVVMDGDPADKGGEATDAIRWISENETVAAVDTDGTVTPLSVGETLVWADVDNGLEMLQCVVTVEDSKLPQIEMQETAYTLTIRKDADGNTQRESRRLRLYFSPSDSKWVNGGQNYVKWTSADPTVAAFETDVAPGVKDVTDTEEGPGAEEGTDTEEGPGAEEGTDTGEGSDTETESGTAALTISGNTVAVTAVGAGETTISAVIVNEEGTPVTDSDGETIAEASCAVTVQEEAYLADRELPRPVALTNTQTTLKDVTLPDGWSWKEPDTALAQLTGGKTKKFAALYKPAGAGEHILPAERLLDVRLLTVENISLGMRTAEGKAQEDFVLTKGQNSIIYVNNSAADTLKQLDENEEYKNNDCYKTQRDDILRDMRKNIIWSSSNTNVISVEPAADGILTADNAGSAKLAAKSAGSATIKASYKLGKKTCQASVKLTVKEAGGTLTIRGVEKFTRVSGAGQAEERYTGLLSAFQTEQPNQVNSKITLTLPGAAKVTAKSGNAKVVAVKSSAAEGDGFAVSLIVKAAGTAQITLTGNDAAKTSRTIWLVVGDAEPGLSDESVTLNLMQTDGEWISLYPAKSPEGREYRIKKVQLGTDEKSTKFKLEEVRGSYNIKAKSGTKTGTYRIKICVAVEEVGTTYELPLTVKVVSKNPVYKVKQARKLNLFCKNDESLLQIDTDEILTRLEYSGLADYTIEKRDGCYYIKAENGATLKSVKKGKLTLYFSGWQGSYTTSFTVGVEKKAPKLTWDTKKVTLYPQAGIQSLWIGIKNPEAVSWDSVTVKKSSGKAKGNYDVEVDREKGGLLLSGKNLNQTDSFNMQIFLSDAQNWAQNETVTYTLQVRVKMGQPAIALENKTLQLNADAAYRGYDAASTAVKWKDGGMLWESDGAGENKKERIRVSVYCDPKDARAKALVQNSKVIFSVTRENGSYHVAARLNNKAVDAGSYKYIVQAAKDGKIWKTPLTLKVVNTAPAKAVKLTAKGSIDVLNREGSFMTLTPALKAVSGEFAIPADREVRLAGRDAHLFEARWREDGKAIELRAKRNETLVIKYQYTVAPILTLRNVNGETVEISTPAVKFKVKQGSVKVSAAPKTALMYSGAYNSVKIDVSAVMKGADTPAIENVTLVGNTDAFAYVYNKEGTGTLTMKDTGRAVKGKSYSLQFKVSFAEQADNVKPVVVRCKVKVK